MKTTTKTTEVFGTLTLPFSYEAEKNDNEKFELTADYLLNEMNIEDIDVVVTDIQGSKFHLKIHDYEVNIEQIFDEDEPA